MSLTLRLIKGSPLTYIEMDDNLTYLEGLSGGTVSNLTTVLGLGNETIGNDIVMTSGDKIISDTSNASIDMDLSGAIAILNENAVGPSTSGLYVSDTSSGELGLFSPTDININGGTISSVGDYNRMKTNYDIYTGLPSGSIRGEVLFVDNRTNDVLYNSARDTTPVVISSSNVSINTGVINSSQIASYNSVIVDDSTNCTVISSRSSTIGDSSSTSGILNSNDSNILPTSTGASYLNSIISSEHCDNNINSSDVNKNNVMMSSRYSEITSNNSETRGNVLISTEFSDIINGVECGIYSNSHSTLGGSALSENNAMIGGTNNDIIPTSIGIINSVIVGGKNNTFDDNIAQSVIVGGDGINATKSNTTYVSDFAINKSHAVPTSSASTEGSLGSITWDLSYLYVKIASGGSGAWKRVALSTF